MEKSFINEIIGRLLLIILSAIIFFKIWWLPLIIAPLSWQFWELTYKMQRRIYSKKLKIIADIISHIIWVGYILYSTIAFGIITGKWYGCFLGIVIGIIVAFVLGLFWPKRWHIEKIENSL